MVVTLDYPTLATTMKEYVAAVEDGDDVDFNAAVGWVQCRHPFVEGLDKPTKEVRGPGLFPVRRHWSRYCGNAAHFLDARRTAEVWLRALASLTRGRGCFGR